MDTDKLDKIEIIIETVKFVAFSAFLVFVFFDAEFSDVLWKPAGILLKGVLICFSYVFGWHFANVHKAGWKNYIFIFYCVGIITILAWAGLGTYNEGGDPLFGGGETVVDFVPAKVARSNHAIAIFFSLFIPASYGIYRKRKQS